jgi:hypothetical protein
MSNIFKDLLYQVKSVVTKDGVINISLALQAPINFITLDFTLEPEPDEQVNLHLKNSDTQETYEISIGQTYKFNKIPEKNIICPLLGEEFQATEELLGFLDTAFIYRISGAKIMFCSRELGKFYIRKDPFSQLLHEGVVKLNA